MFKMIWISVAKIWWRQAGSQMTANDGADVVGRNRNEMTLDKWVLLFSGCVQIMGPRYCAEKFLNLWVYYIIGDFCSALNYIVTGFHTILPSGIAGVSGSHQIFGYSKCTQGQGLFPGVNAESRLQLSSKGIDILHLYSSISRIWHQLTF
jgi:hypothetical protein